MMKLAWLGPLLLVVAVPVSAQSVKAGIDAWSAGRHAEAVAIWRPLAGKGNADAAFNLGQAFKLGRGVPVDLSQAQLFYEQAATARHVEAQTSLGLLLFQNGSRSAALRWLGQAADSGEPRAMLVYGTALFNGDGVAEDRVRAYAFVSRAAAQGLAPARATLTEMDQLIPLDERQKGVALAQSWVAATKVAQATPPRSPVPKAPPQSASGQRRLSVPSPSPSPAVAPARAGGPFRIQLGAFRDRAAANGLYARLAPKLGGTAMTLVPSGTMTRLQVGPYATRAAAMAACAALRPQPCFPVAVP